MQRLPEAVQEQYRAAPKPGPAHRQCQFDFIFNVFVVLSGTVSPTAGAGGGTSAGTSDSHPGTEPALGSWPRARVASDRPGRSLLIQPNS